jgi:hypothetical protein
MTTFPKQPSHRGFNYYYSLHKTAATSGAGTACPSGEP